MANETGGRQADSETAARPAFGMHVSLVRSLVRKASVGRDLWRIHGGPKFMSQILPWMIHRRYLYYEGSLAGGLPGFEAQMPEAHIAPVEPSDLPFVLRARPGYYSLAQLQDRLKQGHVCFLSRVGSEPINIRWAFVGSAYLPYLSRTLILVPGEYYFDEVFTVPRWRHRGIDRQAFCFMLSWFKNRGFKTHTCFLTPWDVHLHRRYESLGMAKIGEVRFRPLRVKNAIVLEGRIQDLGRKRIATVPREFESR